MSLIKTKCDKSNSFAYVSVFNAIKKDIISGKYTSGELLPPEKELEEKYYVSRTTIRKSIALLVEEELVTVKQGYGTEVLAKKTVQNLNSLTSISGSLIKKGHAMSVKNMYICVINGNKEMCDLLQIPHNSKLALINRIQTADGIPITIAKNYIPLNLVKEIEKQKENITSLYSFLKEKYGLIITGHKDTISACNANFEDSVLLEIAPLDALITVKRICYQGDIPIEIDEVKIVASKYEFEIFKKE